MFRPICFITVVSALLAAGCGGSGGQSSSSTSSGSGSSGTAVQSETLGHAALKFNGKIQSNVSSTTGNIAVVGAAGATFSELNYLPANSLANSSILYFDGVNSLDLYNNGTTQEIVGGKTSLDDYCFTHDGHILFCAHSPTQNYTEIYECYYDGSGLTQLTTSNEDHASVSVTPNNSTILFSDTINLRTINFNGTNEKVIGTGTNGKFSPDGTQIAFLFDPGSGNVPYLMPASGGTATLLDPTGLDSYYFFFLDWSQDGTKLGLTGQSSTSNRALVADSANNNAFYSVSGGNGYDFFPTFAPDGHTMALVRGQGDSSLVQCSLDGNNPQVLLTSSPGFEFLRPKWSPLLGARAFVGTGGSMSTTAAGFLWSEKNSGFSSLLSFSATTPSTATVSAETGAGSTTSAVFDLHADTITNLKYTNSYYVPAVSVNPNASDALVSFDSTTGFVTTVVPFFRAQTLNSSRKLIGSVATYTGKFPAIYNSKGVNVAPQGATQVSLDVKSGKLVSWH
jgi:hypothetical protein